MDKEYLKQILIDQREGLNNIKDVVPRLKLKELSSMVSSKQIIIVSGIRRSGKSTLLNILRKTQAKSDYYINFDDDRLINFTVEDFQTLIEVFVELFDEQEIYYFDEIQNIQGWERFARRLHNQGKKVFITGSNASLLSKELGTHLTGRHITIKLYPYSFTEFIAKKNKEILCNKNFSSSQIALIKKYFAEFKKFGGMPEYLDNLQIQYLQTLYENILFKDIIVRHKIANEKAIKELVYYLASNNAKTFTYNSLRKLLGLSNANTIATYCEYLENSYLCFTVNRFSFSLKKQIGTLKKIYFIDQALAQSVGFRFSEDNGRTLENIVFLELKRHNKEIFFHNEEKECDFLIREGYNIVSAIQVCVSLNCANTRAREIAGLVDAMETYNLASGIIITENETGTETVTIGKNKYKITIVACPLWLLGNR